MICTIVLGPALIVHAKSRGPTFLCLAFLCYLLWSGLFPLEVLILMCFSLWWTYIAAWLVHFADKFQSMILDWHTPRGRLHLFGLWCDAWEGATCPAGIPHDLTDWHDWFRLKWLQAIMSLTESKCGSNHSQKNHDGSFKKEWWWWQWWWQGQGELER